MTAPVLPSTEAIDRLMAAFEAFRAALKEVEAAGGEVYIDVRTVDASTVMEIRRVTVLRMEVKATLRVSA